MSANYWGDYTPLNVALELQRKMDKIFKFEIRIGVHAGTCSIVQMSDGATQLFGHAINQAARVMNGAPNKQISISGAYYDDVLHGGNELVRGVDFSRRDIIDKHGNSITCYDATIND